MGSMTLAIIVAIEMLFKLQKGANIGVVYFSMEKVLLRDLLDQYNNVQKGKGCQGSRKRLNIA